VTQIPLSRPDHPDDPAAILSTLREIVLSGRWTQGEFALAFERRVAEMCGSIFAVATNSGASALDTVCAMAGFGPGMEVITTSYTFISTVNAILATGATPMFVDIDPKTYNLDLRDVQERFTPQTKAILLVHQFGIPSDSVSFAQLCKQRGAAFIEDAACGLGSKYNGKAIGSFGLAGLLSFHPRKVLSTGEGGMILTDDESLAVRCRTFGNHGRPHGKPAETVGHNFRMSEFQAALGLWALDRVKEAIERRIVLSHRYDDVLRSIPGVTIIYEGGRAEWNRQSYPIRVVGQRRNIVAEALQKEGIETSPGPLPAHMHPYINARLRPPRLPETEAAYEETLLLPMYAALTFAEQDFVIEKLTNALRKTS
jgi:dTDP-4-amino-4,6-dideoxygalactose transaminase